MIAKDVSKRIMVVPEDEINGRLALNFKLEKTWNLWSAGVPIYLVACRARLGFMHDFAMAITAPRHVQLSDAIL